MNIEEDDVTIILTISTIYRKRNVPRALMASFDRANYAVEKDLRGRSDKKGSTEETEWRDDCANNAHVRHPRQLFGAKARAILN